MHSCRRCIGFLSRLENRELRANQSVESCNQVHRNESYESFDSAVIKRNATEQLHPKLSEKRAPQTPNNYEANNHNHEKIKRAVKQETLNKKTPVLSPPLDG